MDVFRLLDPFTDVSSTIYIIVFISSTAVYQRFLCTMCARSSKTQLIRITRLGCGKTPAGKVRDISIILHQFCDETVSALLIQR